MTDTRTVPSPILQPLTMGGIHQYNDSSFNYPLIAEQEADVADAFLVAGKIARADRS